MARGIAKYRFGCGSTRLRCLASIAAIILWVVPALTISTAAQSLAANPQVPDQRKAPPDNRQQTPSSDSSATADAAPSDTSADAEDDDSADENEVAAVRYANLSVELLADGSAKVMLSVFGSEINDPPQWHNTFNQAFGCQFRETSNYEFSVGFAAPNCPAMAQKQHFGRQGSINLVPVFAALRGTKVTFLSVVVKQRRNDEVTCSPAPRSKKLFAGFCSYFVQLTPAEPASRLGIPEKSLLMTQEQLPQITFAYGYGDGQVERAAAILAFVLLLPVMVTLWMRRAALRAADRIAAGLRVAAGSSGIPGTLHDDRAGIWFGYWRSLSWLMNGALLAWWASSDVVHLNGILAIVFHLPGDSGSWLLHGTQRMLFWFPPLLITVLCQTLSHPVQVRVRGLQWTRSEVLQQSIWSVAASWMPLLMFLNGIQELFGGSSRAGVLWIAAAFFGRQYAARRSAAAQGLKPRALSAGALRDQAFAMAAKLHVKLQQVYVVPTGKARLANAFARCGNSVLFTDTLLRNLNRREVDAVLAHEMAHLKNHHPRKLVWAWMGGIFVSIFFSTYLSMTGLVPHSLAYVIPFVVPIAFTYFFTRRFEYTADREAVLLTGDAEAQITSLVKLHRLNLMPLEWGKVQGKFLTHPSTVLRARAIAKTGSIPLEHLPEIMRKASEEKWNEEDLAGVAARVDEGSGSAALRVPPSRGRDSAVDWGEESRSGGTLSGDASRMPSWDARDAARPLQPAEYLGAQARSNEEAGAGVAVATTEASQESAIGEAHHNRVPLDQPAAPKDKTDAPAAAAEKYALPAAVGGEEKVFSSSYKARNAFRNAWLFLGLLTASPALAVLAMRSAHPHGWWSYAAYAVTWLLTLMVTLMFSNYARSWEAKSLRKRLLQKVLKEGIGPGGWGGRFVGIGPHAGPRTYEHKTVWDIGYFFIFPQRLCFWGEEARFALRREQISDIRVASGPPSWISTPSVYISWRDGQQTHTLNLRPGDVGSVLEMARQTRLFGERLRTWKQSSPGYRDTPPILAALDAPNFGAVTGSLPGASVRGRGLVRSLMLLFTLGWAMSVICGLPFISLEGPAGWYVILTAWTVYLVQLIPYWRHRDPDLHTAAT